MRINSSRNSLARARMIRSANRQRRTKVLSSQTNKTDKGNISSDTTRTDTSTSSQITLYENMEKAAKALQTNVKNLQNINWDTDTDKDKEGTQDSVKKKLLEQINEFAGDYNSLYKSLDQAGGTTNTMFQKQLKALFTTNQKNLAEIGITMDAKGTLSIDSKTLEAADVDKLQKIFCDKDSFAARVSDKCETIKSCANSTIKVLNRMYGTQTAYNRYGTNGYYYGSSGSRYNAKS
ncbi:MAG: hypothetical protein MR392_14975 [Roseburia sp.]|nr:hypothetical protein [Roseburia sp.]